MAIFDFPSRLVWALLAISGLVAYGALLTMGVTIRIGSLLTPLTVVATCLAGSAFYTYVRPDRRLAVATAATAFILTFGATAGVLTYPATALGGAPRDATFMALERSIGIDWPALVKTVAETPILNIVLSLAYQSLLPQIAATVLLLAFTSRHDRLAAYLSLLVATLICTVAISALVPLVGPIASYALGDDICARIPVGDKGFLTDIQALHQGRFTTFDLAKMEGIVTFPSFHCALAVLTGWVLAPIRRVGAAAILLNALVIVSTVPEGGHYVADIPAGSLIAILAIALWSRTAPSATMTPALAATAR